MMLELITGKRRHDLFWALRDVSFEVHERDRIGIIGANGSGKSTLLKIIAGNLQPTSGTVKVHGNISAMLSLATSLNLEETGLSNIRFNLLLNGCPKNRIEELADEIIDFTELGPFIDQPVKTYSSGMNAKLAFGIATAIEPEILIVDEVLSVGDAYFVGKAMKRMTDLCNRGKALMFVSHSITAVQMLCNKAVWMENGSIRMSGRIDQVLKCYEEDARRAEDEAVRAVNAKKSKERLDGNLISDRDLVTSLWTLRLIHSLSTKNSAATYFVRKISVAVEGSEFVDLSLQHGAPTQVGGLSIRVDLLDSAWGRLYERNGFTCRVLTPRTGKSHGGRIVFDHPTGEIGSYHVKLKVQFSTTSLHSDLILEQADLERAVWTKVPSHDVQSLGDGWHELESVATFQVIDPSRLLEARKNLEALVRPPIEITSIEVFCDGKNTGLVNERQNFQIRVKVVARTRVVKADIGINIYRADGVYVFWQSSGQANADLADFLGEAVFVFDFSPNYFSMGDYYVGGYCGNGWDPVNNFPHSEIFSQKVNEAKFQIKGEYASVAFGLLNNRVDVDVIYDQRC
ncbi:MAG: polysaccharide ABC transporter ATP-binding protein [Pseudomonadota bacterium]